MILLEFFSNFGWENDSNVDFTSISEVGDVTTNHHLEEWVLHNLIQLGDELLWGSIDNIEDNIKVGVQWIWLSELMKTLDLCIIIFIFWSQKISLDKDWESSVFNFIDIDWERVGRDIYSLGWGFLNSLF